MKTRIPSLLSLLLVAALFVGGCNKTTPEEHFQQGKELLAKGNRNGAILELKSALQDQPDNAQARLLLGTAYLDGEAYAEAEKEFKQARERGLPDEVVLPALAKSLVGMGEYQQVLDLGIPTHTFGPQARAALYATRAEAQIRLGKEAEAAQSMAAAEAADPNHPEVLLIKARLASGKRDRAEAMRWVDQLLKLHPAHRDALYLKGMLLNAEGKMDEATRVFQQIVAGDPKQYRAHLILSDLYKKANNPGTSEKALQDAEKVAPRHPLVRYARGAFELQRGKMDKASAALQDVLRVDPDNLPAQLAASMAEFGLGHYDQSLKHAGRVLGAIPGNLLAAKLYASSQLKLGDTKAALKTLEPLLGRFPNDASLMALAGDVYFQAKDYSKAQGYLDKAAQLAPENAIIRTRQAAGHLALGERDEALANLEKAASLTDKASSADLALITLQLRGKEYDKALQSVAKLEKKLPDNPLIFNLRAAALLGKNDRAGARRAFEQALAVEGGFFPAAMGLARLDLQDKNPDGARKRLESFLKTSPDHAGAMLALADLAATRRHENEAVQWLEKAAKADPNAVQARAKLIQHYNRQKNPGKALSLAREFANAHPDSPAALDLLGTAQVGGGDVQGAVATFEKLVQKAPGVPDAHFKLAMAQLAAKRVPEARKSLAKALALKPDYLPARDTLIRIELAEGKVDKALEQARQIQAQAPKSPLGFFREAEIHHVRKQYSQAAKAYQAALDRGADGTVMVKLHQVLTSAGDRKGADQRLAEWLKKKPGDRAARMYAAELFMVTNRNREAIAQFEELLRQGGNFPIVLNNLAILYQKEKDPRAAPTAEKAVKLDPNNPLIKDTLGWILVEQGKLPQALDLLRAAVDKAPKVVPIRFHYAVALAKTGNRAEARKQLEQVAASGKNYPEAEQARKMLQTL